MRVRAFIFCTALALLAGCNSLKSVKQALLKTSPYEDYVQSLGKAGLKETVLARQWIEAGEQVFNDSIAVSLPFAETGFFEATVPQARAYRFSAYAGQILTVSGSYKTARQEKLFADLFIWKEDRWKRLSTADSTLDLTYEFDRNETCLLRIQPELLSNTWYSLSIASKPALINPVKGATNKSIGSFYGNARDEGKRSHEGIDIFAPRGTPVIAPTDGVVYSVGTNNLGGKVIWLYDLKRGQTYYFAHLDSQWVSLSANIKKGDTLGQVGNTGNARRTAPHLHFGIYRNGSLDPLHYIQTTAAASSLPLDTSFRSAVYKIAAKEGTLHAAPEVKSRLFSKIPQGTYVKLIARNGSWSRILLPEGQQAYVRHKDISSADRGKQVELTAKDTLWSAAGTHAVPLQSFNNTDTAELLAQYKNFGYVKTRQQVYGWIKI